MRKEVKTFGSENKTWFTVKSSLSRATRELSLDTLANEETSSALGSNRRLPQIFGLWSGAATIAAGCDIPVKRQCLMLQSQMLLFPA